MMKMLEAGLKGDLFMLPMPILAPTNWLMACGAAMKQKYIWVTCAILDMTAVLSDMIPKFLIEHVCKQATLEMMAFLAAGYYTKPKGVLN